MSLVNGFQQVFKGCRFQVLTPFHDAVRSATCTVLIVEFYRHQSGNRPTVPGYGQAFTANDTLKQAGQMSLCFACADGFHETL